MKTLFKITVLMLITSYALHAQKQDIYKQSFDASDLNTLVLDLNGFYLEIEESNDNKVHFDYTIEFENYSKKEIEKVLDEIKVNNKIEGNKLEFSASSLGTAGDVVYSVESLYGITFEGDYVTFKEPSDRQWRKSKQYFKDINSSSRGKSLKEYLKNLRGLDGKGNKKKIKPKNIKILRTKFIIKMPARLNLRLMAVNSSIGFKFDVNAQTNINARNTKLKFQNITNTLNNFDIVNGDFRSGEIKGGSYKFNHVGNVQIAEVSNLTIDSEFTTTTLGEIGSNVKIVDFTSKFWIHNFSFDFGDFQMDTEYSEINMFFPEDMKYYIETYGHDTVHYYSELITEIPPSRKNKPSKMMIIGEETNSNKIQINTVHGIVRFGEDFIDVKQ